MTYKTKNTVVVFAFVAMLMAAPLAIGNAYATTGGNGVVNPTCGIVEPANISLGTIIAGSTSTQEKVVIATSGTIPGTFEIISTDWTGAGAKSTGSLLILANTVGETIEINSHVFVATSGSTAQGTFDSDGTLAQQATALAAAINISTQTVTEDVEPDIGVKAFASENAVLLTAKVAGTGSDAITVTTTDAAKAQVITATLGGGATGAVHMTADKVKVTTQTQSEGAPATTYAQKTVSLATTGVNKVLSTATDPDNAEDIDLYFHLDGVSAKATQTITVLTDLADTDTIVIDGVTFTAEATAADIDGNEFLTTGVAATDAAALEAKIDATLNLRFTADVVGAVVTVTAIKGGTDANAYTLSEGGAGVTLGDTSFNGGVDQLTNLPYSGALTATLTFGTACDSS